MEAKKYQRIIYHGKQYEKPADHAGTLPESIENYLDYNAWSQEFNGLMGIMGKALREEKANRTPKCTAYYSQFKKEHPDQTVLLHYNGNACDPRFETEKFYDGHWLYLDGIPLAADLPEEYNISKIKVEDASTFVEFTGREFDRQEDVAIVRLDDDGKPDWSYCEQATIRAIDYENNVLTVARGCYKSGPKSFEKGKAMVAAHVIEGPWNSRQCNLMWFYNHSSACPRDEQGRQCSDVLSEVLAERFQPGGELFHYDGFELDVLFRYLKHHSYAYLQNWGAGMERQPDCNGDGIGDMGIFDGVDTYEKGVAEFVRKTREKLDAVRPDIIFQADAGYSCQRSFDYLNGVETEGYGALEDGVLNWSHLINLHGFWNANSCAPAMSYLNHRLPIDRRATHRIAFAASVFTGSALCQASSPPRNPDGSYGIFDELVKGEENKLAWLGAPQAPAVHMVHETEDLIDGKQPTEALLEKIEMKKGTASIEDGKWMLKGESGEDAIVFTIPNIKLPNDEFTLQMRASCEPMQDYYPEQARIVTIRPLDTNGNVLLDDTEWWFKHKDRRWAHINHKPFDNYLFFHKVPGDNVHIEVHIESTEPVAIESLQLFPASDAMYRLFENGIVLSNPGLHPWTFPISQIAPGNRYRRLKRSERQDTETNNGQAVGDEVVLTKHDALFLVKN